MLLTIPFVVIAILLIRYVEGIPRVIFWFIARDIESGDYSAMTPLDLGLTAELIEIPMKKGSFNAWFFPSEVTPTAGVLCIPNWYQRGELENAVKTAGILQTAGYNVLLPIYHWGMDESYQLIFKRNIGIKQCQKMIEDSYSYFIRRPEIDKKNIGIWSNSSGTILACQIIKDTPIKAVVLEDGPITLWNEISVLLHERKDFPFLLTKFTLIILLFPFIWRTRWMSERAIKNLRICPSFLIASREESQKRLWQTFSRLHKPKQLWFEHALHPRCIRDTWIQEYFLQLSSFFDFWFLRSPQPEFHYDFSIKHKKKGKYSYEIRITAMPPQVEKVPLQIILSDSTRYVELRIWFNGASLTLYLSSKYKMNNMSILTFRNVEQTDHPYHQWIKRDARLALNATIEEISHFPPNKLKEVMEKYYFLKGILLYEQAFEEFKEEAKNILETEIKSKYWKSIIKIDSDSRLIMEDDSEHLQSPFF